MITIKWGVVLRGTRLDTLSYGISDLLRREVIDSSKGHRPMNLYSQYALAVLGTVLLFTCVKRYALRKWLGIALVGLGFGAILVLPPLYWQYRCRHLRDCSLGADARARRRFVRSCNDSSCMKRPETL